MDFKLGCAQLLSSVVGMPEAEILNLLEVPPQTEMGDYALPCFALAKSMRKPPIAIAQDVAAKIEAAPFLNRVEPLGPYVNFFLNEQAVAKSVIEEVREKGEKFGGSQLGNGGVVCIDYSSINIAKPFHIGHLSSTVIGQALRNMYDFLGYRAFGINYLGDWGTQFGKLIVAFKLWGDREMIEQGGVRELFKIYVKFHEEADKDDSLNDQARAEFKKIEGGDQEALALFAWFKEITLKEVGQIYDGLGITFDSYAGESFYNDKMDRVVDELREKNLLTVDDGASVVMFADEDKMPPCLILKADGATLYATRDIASAIYRKENYNFVRSLYVVAYQQTLHFKQVFKVIDMMGYEWAKDMEHVAFGMVSIEEGTLSTRSGRVLFLKEVFEKATERALELIEEKSPDLEDKRIVAAQVGVGALIYGTLSSARIKDINFSWSRVLNFEGETGPYCQYTYARASSVLRKAGDDWKQSEIDYNELCDESAQSALKLIAAFPDAILRAVDQNEPYHVTRIVTDIAQSYNRFYFGQRILDAPEKTRDARLALTAAVREVIGIGLRLIGIKTPERM